MFPITTDTAVDGLFVAGNPTANPVVPATVLDAAWANHVQNEIINAVEGANISLSRYSDRQLLNAIHKIAFRGWRRYLSYSSYSTVAAFKAGTYYAVGVHQSFMGELFNTGFYVDGDRRTMLYEMTINIPAAAGYTFTFPTPLHVDDAAYLAVDNVDKGCINTAGISLTLAEGDHVISVLHNDAGGSYYDIILPEWIDESNIILKSNGVWIETIRVPL
jgi:hypothetical protein